MAFQGKGILGGFSGKIGKVVGYRRYGKSIMQSNNTKQRRKFGYSWDFIDQILVDLRNCSVGNFFIKNDTNSVGFLNGGRSSFKIGKGGGGCEFQFKLIFDLGAISLGNSLANYSFVLQQYSILVSPSFLNVFEMGNSKISVGGRVPNERLRIIIKDEMVSYWRDGGNYQWVKFYDSLITPSYPLYMVASMQTIDRVVSGLKFGGNNTS